MKVLIMLITCTMASLAQAKPAPKPTPKPAPPLKLMACVEPLPATGEHVRFTPQEHIELLLSQKAGEWEYRQWESDSRNLDWFSGKKPVPLAEIKRHMPRAMLLELRFPVDQNPPVGPDGYKRLIESEKKYAEATAHSRQFPRDLMVRYGIGPQAIFDQDLGGMTPQSGCGKYEEQEMPK